MAGQAFPRRGGRSGNEEMAASVYLPDYEAVSDGWEESWAAGWLKELLPVLWEQYDQMREQTEKKEDRQWEEIETERETGKQGN